MLYVANLLITSPDEMWWAKIFVPALHWFTHIVWPDECWRTSCLR